MLTEEDFKRINGETLQANSLLKAQFTNTEAFEHFCSFLEKSSGPIGEELANVARCILQTSLLLKDAIAENATKQHKAEF